MILVHSTSEINNMQQKRNKTISWKPPKYKQTHTHTHTHTQRPLINPCIYENGNEADATGSQTFSLEYHLKEIQQFHYTGDIFFKI